MNSHLAQSSKSLLCIYSLFLVSITFASCSLISLPFTYIFSYLYSFNCYHLFYFYGAKVNRTIYNNKQKYMNLFAFNFS